MTATFQGCARSTESRIKSKFLLQSLASLEFSVRAVIVAAPSKSSDWLHISTTDGMVY